MTYIFINYNQKQYYLAHIYEQFLFNELKYWKYNPNANIGNGIIYIKTEKNISYKIFTKIAKNVFLKQSYYQSLVNQIKNETLSNVNKKLSYECFNFQAKSLNQLKKALSLQPEQNIFEKFGKNIIKKNEIFIFDQNKNKLIFSGTFSFKTKSSNRIPKLIIKNNNSVEITFRTNAKNIIDGLILNYLSQKTVIKNYLWLSCTGKLFWTFLINKKHINKLNNLKITEAIKNLNLEYQPKGNLKLEKFWQIADWGKYIKPKKIQEKLNKISNSIKKIEVRIKNNNINILTN